MLARFLSNTRGGVAPMMAVVAIPLLVAVRIAVDYTRANAARAAFQVALDSTPLMLSKDAAKEAQDGTLQNSRHRGLQFPVQPP